uniref:Ras and EF-hand domain-containing protein homolog n=1 Tax=Phallusia mammillata TaxID=59560 RepID=A0A6F9DPT2_9ASCI|nr:ras and EF-hand domain-containing protein homolog [Phallusia mammillata]
MATIGDEDDAVLHKAKELFSVCDKEGKGYINKVDMQHLNGTLPLNGKQLEEVFDSLDNDGNGFLTFEEFSDGFGGFLRLHSQSESTHDTESSDNFANDETYSTSVVEDDSENILRDVINRLVSNYSLDKGNEKVILDLCRRVQEDKDMQGNTVEEFIHLVVHELNAAKSEKSALERLLKERSVSHEDEVRQLYQEMERQINEERDKTLNEEVQKERSLSLALREELKEKERQLDAVQQQHESLEQQIMNLSSGKDEVKSENSQLVQLNQSLMEDLQNAQRDLEATQIRMATIKQQKDSQEEIQLAEQEAHKLDLEKKSLIKQLEMLRDQNRKLQDDKDEVLERSKHFQTPPSKQLSTSTPKHKTPLFTQGSNVGKYFQTELNGHSFIQSPVIHEDDEESEGHNVEVEVNGHLNATEVDGKIQLSSSTTQSDSSSSISDEVNHPRSSRSQNSSIRRKTKSKHSKGSREQTPSESSAKERQLNAETNGSQKHNSAGLHHRKRTENEKRARARFYRKLSKNPYASSSSSGEDGFETQNVNGNVGNGDHQQHIVTRTDTEAVATNHDPDRVYKIVFVGNSGVGKTSFIQQFVSSTFVPNLAATIGVDYQVKTLAVDGQLIALQLWDTAGQERYRSITRQYFRKADGVVVMYDVTNEKSFLAVRNWMQSVQEGADPTAVILLLGNKNDIASSRTRQVTPKEGTKLAEEYGAKFSETSAKSGDNITSSMILFAGDLTRLEDEQRDSVLSLAASDEEAKKAACCAGRRGSM